MQRTGVLKKMNNLGTNNAISTTSTADAAGTTSTTKAHFI